MNPTTPQFYSYYYGQYGAQPTAAPQQYGAYGYGVPFTQPSVGQPSPMATASPAMVRPAFVRMLGCAVVALVVGAVVVMCFVSSLAPCGTLAARALR